MRVRVAPQRSDRRNLNSQIANLGSASKHAPPSTLLYHRDGGQNTLRDGLTPGADRDPTGNSDFLTAS